MSPVAEAPFTQQELLRVAASEFLARLQVSQAMGLTYDGKRNLGHAFGYKDVITVQDYRIRYERGGIAGRIVDAIAKATWRGGCELIEDENPETLTPFEGTWDALDDRLAVVSELQAADILSRISTYSVILIGDGEDITQELRKGNGTTDGIIYLTPYMGSELGMTRATRTFPQAIEGMSQASVFVDSYVEDPKDPRFGQPLTYRFQRTEFGATSDLSSKKAHWSRVVHFAEGGLDNKVFGRPALMRSWNDLDNLDKVIGGGAEAFFQRANQGRLWSIAKDAPSLTDAQLEDYRDQIEKFQHNIIRDVRMQGVEATTLGSDVANFAQQLDAILTILAGSNEIPKRILTGSEMGELASSQDRDNWRDQVNGRRENYATPSMVRRFVKRLMDYDYMPVVKSYDAKWGSVLNMTEEEKKNKALGMAQVNQTNKSVVFLDSEIRQECYEKAPLTAKQIAADQAVQPEPEPVAAPVGFPRAAAEADLVERLAAAIDDDNGDLILEILGDVPGHEFHGNQYVSATGAVGGKKGENFVKKAHAPESYGSHYKNINDPAEASALFEQSHAMLEKQGYVRDKPTGLPFQYQKEAVFMHPLTGHVAVLRKDYFAADPVYKAKGYKGSSRVKLEIKAKA